MAVPDIQEIVLNDFTPGIFTHREFANSQSAEDGAGAEFINATDAPVPTTDYTRDTRTLGSDVDITSREYAYGCVGSNAGLQPLPRPILSHVERAHETDPTPASWAPIAREVTLATAILSPIATPNDSSTLPGWDGLHNGGVVPYLHPDQIHVLSAWYFDRGDGHELLYRWRVYTQLDIDGEAVWSALDVLLTDTPGVPGIDSAHSHFFGSGGFAVLRLNVGQLTPHVVGVLGQYNSNYSHDGLQPGELDPGIVSGEHPVNTQLGTWMFPSETGHWGLTNIDPLDGESFASGGLGTAVYWASSIVAHQNRMITMASNGADDLATPSADNILPQLTYQAGNEFLYYNNHNLPRYTFADDPEAYTFITDAVGGFGSWGSMNANELFLVKNTGGAVTIRGDVAAPQVVNLPGVESTYGAGAIGVATNLGFIYAARDGVFVWSGDISECLSPQLGRTWFWNSPTSTNDFKTPTQPKGKLNYRYPYVYVPGNWVLDVRTKSWWRLTPPSADHDYTSYEVSANGVVYAVNLNREPATARPVFVGYDPAQSASSYRWISQPLIRTRAARTQFRKIRLTATGRSDIRVTVIGLDGERAHVDFPAARLSNTRPTTLTGNIHLDAEDATVVVEVTNPDPTSPAATVHRIGLEYREQTLATRV